MDQPLRKVIYAMSVSLDGFIEATDGDLRWSYPNEELHRHFNQQERQIDLHLYGRGLYENMASYWPTADQNPSAPQVERDYARLWKTMRKIVFSTTLEQVGWNSQLVRGDIAAEVKRLKAQPGGDMSVGGAGLAASFMRLGLIDEYRLYFHPLILGGGKPMFAPLQDKIALELVETHPFGSGVVLLRYRKAQVQA
jgi:dihydrofolate reductase